MPYIPFDISRMDVSIIKLLIRKSAGGLFEPMRSQLTKRKADYEKHKHDTISCFTA